MQDVDESDTLFLFSATLVYFSQGGQTYGRVGGRVKWKNFAMTPLHWKFIFSLDINFYPKHEPLYSCLMRTAEMSRQLHICHLS